LTEIGSKAAEKNSAQTNKQTDKQTNKHYENNGHLAVNQNSTASAVGQSERWSTACGEIPKSGRLETELGSAGKSRRHPLKSAPYRGIWISI